VPARIYHAVERPRGLIVFFAVGWLCARQLVDLSSGTAYKYRDFISEIVADY
jgi:hypothetical protein